MPYRMPLFICQRKIYGNGPVAQAYVPVGLPRELSGGLAGGLTERLIGLSGGA